MISIVNYLITEGKIRDFINRNANVPVSNVAQQVVGMGRNAIGGAIKKVSNAAANGLIATGNKVSAAGGRLARTTSSGNRVVGPRRPFLAGQKKPFSPSSQQVSANKYY